MSTFFSEAEVKDRLSYLTVGFSSIRRKDPSSVTRFFRSLRFTAYQAMAADSDAVFYLASLLARASLVRVERLQALLALVDRIVLTGNSGPVGRTSAADVRVPEVRQVLSQLSSATGATRARLLDRLDDLVALASRSLYESNANVLSAGLSRESALEMAPGVISDIVKLWDRIGVDLVRVLRASEELSRADLPSYALEAQNSLVDEQLAAHEADIASNGGAQVAVLDMLLAASLMREKAAALQLLQVKYDGAVTVTSVTTPTLTGVSFPRYNSGAESAVITVDGVVGTLSLAAATGPSLSFAIPTVKFIRPESGYVPVAACDGITMAFGGTAKPHVHPGSFSLTTLIAGSLYEVRDNSGDLRVWTGFFGAVLGAIDYTTGVWSVTYLAPPDAGQRIQVAYSTRMLHVGTTWGELKFFHGNALVTVSLNATLAGTSITSGTALAIVLGLLLPAGFSASYNNTTQMLTLASTTRGSLSRLMMPEYAVAYEVNEDFGGAIYNTEPTNLNEWFGALNSTTSDAFGADVTLADIATSGSASSDVAITAPVTVVASGTASTNVLDPTELLVNNSGAEAGDIVLVQSPIPAAYRVASSNATSITITTEFLRTFSANETLTAVGGDTNVFSCIRAPLTIEHAAPVDASELVVTVAGLGLSGTDSAEPTGFTLDADLPTSSVLRAGDTVYQGSTLIGTVLKYDGTTVTIDPVLDTTITGDVEIRSAAFDSFTDLHAEAAVGSRSHTDITVNIADVLNLAVFGNTGLSAKDRLVDSMQSMLTAYHAALTAYSVPTSSSMSALLRFLQEERLRLPYVYLAELRFVEFGTFGPEALSETAQLELALEDAVVSLSGQQGSVEVFVADLGIDERGRR